MAAGSEFFGFSRELRMTGPGSERFMKMRQAVGAGVCNTEVGTGGAGFVSGHGLSRAAAAGTTKALAAVDSQTPGAEARF